MFNNIINTYTINAKIEGGAAVSKVGAGTANLSAVNTYSGPTSISQGTLAITGAGQLGGGLYAANILNIGTFNYASSAAQTLSGAISGSGGLTVSGSGALTLAGTNTLAWVNVNGGAAGALLTLNGSLSIPGTANDLNLASAANDRSVMKQNGTLTIGRDLKLGNGNPSAGACYQASGSTTVTNYLGVGGAAGGYGYYRLSGGTLNVRGYLEIATSGSGVFDLFDGILSTENTFDIDRRSGGVGVLNVFGGIAKAPSNGNPMQMGRADFAGPVARLTVMGSGVVDAANGSGTTKILDMNAGNGNGGTTAVNLLTGGTLIANKVSATRVGTTVFNFDGGTLKASPLTTVGATFLTGLDSAVVYPGGAVIDTTNASITITQSLMAPVGYGISAIPLISNGAGYIGAPLVNITGGSGTGVTAIASVDLTDGSPTKGRVTGITMTSKGTGYKNTDVLTVALSGGGFTTAAVTGACTFAVNSSAGGLTKLGSGLLTLSGTNTYGGATTISNGTLKLGIANALPTNSVVNVDGGTYDLGCFVVTNGQVNVTTGSIINGGINCAGLTKNGGGVALFSALQTAPAPIVINGGTLQLNGTAGLYEGRVSGEFNLAAPNPQTAIKLCPTNAYMFFGSSGASGGIWIDYSTYIYSGVIWNRSPTNETWTFCKSFDDSVRIMVDGRQVINKYNDWDTVTTTNYVVTPGPHAFEVRMGQGGGGVGQANNKTVPGAGFDRQGRSNSAFCVPIVDPGDGSLLTLGGRLADASTVELAANTMLDLGKTNQTLAGLSGSGTVSNGALTVTGVVSPAGTNAIGTLTVKGNTTLSGKFIANVATNGTNASDSWVVEGDLTLSSATLEIQNPLDLSISKVYTLGTYSGTLLNAFTPTNLPDPRWTVRTTGNKIQLYFKNGTVLRLM
jgi:autotransporter-associated beta strand protein